MSKLTIQLTDEMDEVIDELADVRQLPKTQVMRRAVLLMKFLDDAQRNGQDILLRDRDSGLEKQLVLESSLNA